MVVMLAEKVEEVHRCLLGHLLGLQVHLKKQKSLWMLLKPVHHFGVFIFHLGEGLCQAIREIKKHTVYRLHAFAARQQNG